MTKAHGLSATEHWILQNIGQYELRIDLEHAVTNQLSVPPRTVRDILRRMEERGLIPRLGQRATNRQQQMVVWAREYARSCVTRDQLVRAVAQQWGVAQRTAQKLIRQWGILPSVPTTPTKASQAPTNPGGIKVSEDVTPEARMLTSESTVIRSVEDLLEYFHVDQRVWEVERQVVNKWDMGYCTGEGDDRAAESIPLFQIKVWLRRRKAPDALQVVEFVRESLDRFSPVYPKLERKQTTPDQYMVEVSIPDLHFGSLCWGKETGERYDLNLAKVMFNEATDYFISSITEHSIRPELIVFPVGNDFFNVNSMENITVHNTRQDEDDRWQKTFLLGRDLLVGAIDRLVQVAPVQILIIPGNHDLERIFYMGAVLESHYRLQPEVTVDASPTLRKYLRYGQNLIGYAHGKDEKLNNLPNIMAREAPRDWGETTYREIHVGHLHHSQDRVYLSTQEFDALRVRIMPTIAARSAWATAKGYSHLREAIALVWDKRGGCTTEFKYHVPEHLR